MMSLYDYQTILIALLAVVISAVSLIRTRQVAAIQIEQGKVMADLAKRQLEQIEYDDSVKDRPSFHVELRSFGHESQFCVTNIGDGTGKEVDFEIVDFPDSTRFDTGLFPIDIKPQTGVNVDAYIHAGMPEKYTVRLSWTERDGIKKEELFKVKLS